MSANMGQAWRWAAQATAAASISFTLAPFDTITSMSSFVKSRELPEDTTPDCARTRVL